MIKFNIPSAVEEVSLAGTWSVTSADGSATAAYPVPGDVHSALVAGGIIPHPYKGRNELAVRWVADMDWIARHSFELVDAAASGWYLDIDYLDTVADVLINGKLALHAENCFRRYRPDVGALLQEGSNSIEIRFHSNTAAANAKQAAQPFPIPYSVNNCPIPNGNMLRKPACHFGWDWNLAIVPFGLYGRIVLRRTRNMRIEHVQVKQVHSEERQSVAVDIDVILRGREDAHVTVSFDGKDRTRLVKGDYGDVKQRFRFVVDTPELWWPSGSGGQRLYDLKIECDGQVEHRRIGLRKVELLTDEEGHGSRFAFRVNGAEIFCKGANWIPADALPSAATEAATRKLLQAAKDANMNMIRVWGGGYYEKDFFYEICDELGLLVWQDFMFACNLYPSTPAFLAEVKEEVEYQVRRLQHHACLALWCGDNELIGALTWFKESRDNRDRYLVNYDRLNRAIEEAMKAADPSGLWWPSSPSPGVLNFGDAWHDDSRGDMHFWSVWHEGRDFEHYHDVKPRFCSEFGFQSFPSLRLVKEFAESDEDLNISSAVMEHHQRNAGGNARIAETMFRNFRFPMDFGSFVYLSQIQHGLAMRMAVEYWRSLRPHCMGTLYWQLNDTWPVASWSGLDHGGGWKALHYMARRFYAPVLVTARKSGAEVIVSAVHDLVEAVALSLEVVEVKISADQSIRYSGNVTVAAGAGQELCRFVLADMEKGSILFLNWKDEKGLSQRNHFTLQPYKLLNLPKPELESAVDVNGGALNITITGQHLALYVSAECDVAGQFSDNAFDLLGGESRTITFVPDHPSDLARAKDTLVIRDLYSSSH